MNPILGNPHVKMREIIANLNRVIEGKEDRLELVVLALVAGGHILIEDIPGVGKTTLARALARTIDGKFARIQFTPDLLPTDITGINVYQAALGSFTFKSGPVFANIVLADEINRASARTQSALLEAMSEEHVTIDGNSYPLPTPFIVLATQNPIEYHGTYPLPEAQLDRFMLKIDLGYPPLEIEQALAINRTSHDPLEAIHSVISLETLRQLRACVDQVRMDPAISQYLLQIVSATRRDDRLRLGVSTRGTLQFARICRALALFQDRDYIIPEDVKQLAGPVLSHRIVLNSDAQYGSILPSVIIQDILDKERVPR